jgi:cell shape-determining protein MreC
MNQLPESTRRLIGNRKRSNRYLLLFLLLILIWFPGHYLYQYSFGFLSAESGSSAMGAKNKFFSWINNLSGNKDIATLEVKEAALLKENAALKEQIRSLGVQFKNDDFQSTNKLTEVKVIGNDNFLASPLLYLFGGKDNGLRDGMPVVDEAGVMVGKITQCQAKIALVVLTPNHLSRIGARIAGTEWNGILEGNRDLRAVLEMLPLDSQVKESDQVVTDNQDPDIPAGILLGTVSLVRESDNHLFKEAILDLPFDSKKMDKVWVVTGRK